jgi:transcriptional regulator with XRE-family HTH domain
MATLGERLLEERTRRGLSRAELAHLAGVKVWIIQDLERGRTRMPAGDRLIALARALKVPLEKLTFPERKAS